MQQRENPRSLIRVMATVVAVLLFALFVWRHSGVLGDPDLWWHIKTGQDILATGAVPQVDSYSYTYAGKPWIAKEWLSQIILALTYQVGGWNGILWVAAAAASAAATYLYVKLSEHIRPDLAALWVLVTAFAILPVVVARPHIFTFLPLVFLCAKFFEAARAGRAPNRWLLLIVVFWANLHGSFALVFALAGFAFLEFLECHRLRYKRVAFRWLIFLMCCPLLVLLNPYGVDVYRVAFDMFVGNPAKDLITEWQPLNAQADRTVEVPLVITLGLLLWARAKLSFSRALFILFMLHMMLAHIRFIYVFFLLAPLLTARGIAEGVLPVSAEAWAKKPRDDTQRFVMRHEIVLQRGIAALACAVFVAMALSNPFRPPPRRTIDGALAYLREHHPKGHLFNDYNLGGPLILNGFKTFVDGRSEQLFLGSFMKDYIASDDAGGEAAFDKIMTSYDIGWTLFPPASARNAYLAKRQGWKQTFADDYAVIYEKQ